MKTTLEMLIDIVEALAQEPPGHFCYEDTYEDEDGNEHFGGVLDVEFHVNYKRQVNGVTVTTGTGGPHIELDTRRKKVIGYWAGEVVQRHYPKSDQVHDFWEEIWECA